MHTELTQYPERYIAHDDRPKYFKYVPREATLLGVDAGGAPFVDGTIIASVQGAVRERYWLDPDMVMQGVGVIHFIWLRDAWQQVQVPYIRSRDCRHIDDIEASFAAKEVTNA